MLDVHQVGHPLQRFVKEGVVDIDLAALVARPLPAAYDGRLDALGERPRHAPLIDASVAVEVAQLAHLRPLSQGERPVFPEHPKGLMQTLRGLRPRHLGKILAVGPVADPEVAAPRGNRHPALRHEGDGAEFHDLAFRKGDVLPQVELVLERRRGRGGRMGRIGRHGRQAHGVVGRGWTRLRLFS